MKIYVRCVTIHMRLFGFCIHKLMRVTNWCPGRNRKQPPMSASFLWNNAANYSRHLPTDATDNMIDDTGVLTT